MKPRILLVMLLFASLLFAVPANAQTSERCFAETGQCMSGPIRAYWERNGGLSVFGFPITAQSSETVEGVALQVQWFERDRLEIQPNGAVTAGRLGVERLEQLGTPWNQGSQAGSDPACRAFPETGYQVCGAFARYWANNGGLERFGFPVTGEFQLQLEGQSYTVQYFERRRFELHPEIAPDAILLGLLGREVYDARQGASPAPAPAPAQPNPTPSLPASFNACQDDPYADQAPNHPIKIANVDKRGEIVYLQNVSAETINLDGWIMCSIKGNQTHDGIAGLIAPGETRAFAYAGGNIWNNSSNDNGALYNSAGQLVSYWRDPSP